MIRTLLIALCLTGCGCSVFPDKPAPEAAPLVVEYTVPLLKLDGSIDNLVIEDNRPELGVKILFCKELAGGLVCLTDENGRQGWLEIPVAQAPKPEHQT